MATSFVPESIALHFALSHGNEAIVKELIEYGPKEQISVIDNLGNTPLHVAILSGNVAMLKIVLNGPLEGNAEYDEQVRVAMERPNTNGHTPLAIALMHADSPRHPYYEMMGLLLERGANPNSEMLELPSGTQVISFY